MLTVASNDDAAVRKGVGERLPPLGGVAGCSLVASDSTATSRSTRARSITMRTSCAAAAEFTKLWRAACAAPLGGRADRLTAGRRPGYRRLRPALALRAVALAEL